MSVFKYASYKAFLKTYIAGLPRNGRGEINRIAEQIGVHPTLVSQVLGGSKDFSIEQAHKLCDYLGLSDLEKDFFILLVQQERAGTKDLKNYYGKKVSELKKQSLNLTQRLQEHRRLTDYEQSVFYSSWLYSALRLFSSVGSGQTADAMAAKFSLPRGEVIRLLNFLKEAQLVSEENGIYRMGTQHTHLEFGSPFMSRHHSNWRMKAIQRSEDLGGEEMMFTSPISLSHEDFRKIREELVSLIKATSKIVKESPAEDVACLNLDLFWLRKPLMAGS